MKDSVLLPLSQYERFQKADLTKTELNQAAYFIQGLIKEHYIYFVDSQDYLPRAQKWFDVVYKPYAATKKVFLKKLIKVGLIECNNYYRPGTSYYKGICLGYRINPELTDDLMILLEFNNYFKDRVKICNDWAAVEQRKTLRQLRTTLKTKEIQNVSLNGFIAKIVTNDYVKCRMSVNYEIQADVVKFENSKIFGVKETIEEYGLKTNKYYGTQNLINGLSKAGLLLFEINNRYRLVKTAHYSKLMEQKRDITIKHYSRVILDLKKRKGNASRDITNGRTYSNYTHFPSSRKVNGVTIPALIDFFTLAGERIYTFDLQNSQVTLAFKLMLDELNLILADIEQGKDISLEWLQNVTGTKDVVTLKFRAERIKSEVTRLMRSGADFYEYFKDLINNSSKSNVTRDKAKRMIFEILFSSKDFNSSGKTLLTEVMPEFVAFVADYKKRAIKHFAEMERLEPIKFNEVLEIRSKNRTRRGKVTDAKSLGNAAFSVKLQLLESSIFIDSISWELKKQKVLHLTKHDSISFPVSQTNKVNQLMTKALNEAIGEGMYKLRFEQPNIL